MRLIDADALMKNIPSEEMIAKMAVAHAPTIEPKRGEWLPDENGDFRCTNCGRIAEWEFFEDNFCPNCGARMKTADNERAIEQMQPDMLYEPTYNSEDGSM